MAIPSIQTTVPDLPKYAIFKIVFHSTNSTVATRCAITQLQREAGTRPDRFHTLSYVGMVATFGRSLPTSPLTLYLGKGVSLCTIKNGDTDTASEEYSSLSDLTSNAWLRDINGGAILGIDANLNEDEGCQLLYNIFDPMVLACDNHICTLLNRDYTQAMYADNTIVGIGDTVAAAFRGCISENTTPIRNKIIIQLACYSDLLIHIIISNEEKQIACDALKLVAAA